MYFETNIKYNFIIHYIIFLFGIKIKKIILSESYESGPVVDDRNERVQTSGHLAN